MQLTLRQAAREAGISKSTLARAVAAGRVSATRTEDGRLLFDPAELFRVYEPARASRPDAEAVSQDATGEGTPGTPPAGPETSQSRRETGTEGQDATGAETALAAEVRLLRERLAEMRQERDEWREQAKVLGNRPLMLPAPAELTRQAETSAGRRWWPFRRAG